ncbi:hypothetical protein C922_03723 [Plasmodium inui San Antonio 1]|uniref:Uncharacterized protein n=1 Tax=Plasmodium inui San Antonio 1 TaxID=1237626 RepID=W7AKX9_9APIC|nr:hypothetical protein C922_03723 [Plasmodium inui San Antonio 1]EUD65996.1 hypothetical protein C922_03723 [Plasmodium inui San Antonio 1]
MKASNTQVELKTNKIYSVRVDREVVQYSPITTCTRMSIVRILCGRKKSGAKYKSFNLCRDISINTFKGS